MLSMFVTSGIARFCGGRWRNAGVAKGGGAAVEAAIVDAQVHLWKAESEDWNWVPGMKPQMPEPFTIEKLVPLMDQAGVNRAVIVPPSWPGDRMITVLKPPSAIPTASR